MLFEKKQPGQIDVPKFVDAVENVVYVGIKPLGFRKHGRTLHRFVSGDISQVVNFQVDIEGLHDTMCVNLGIRVPECAERCFQPESALKKYYKEYECNIRTRLESVCSHSEKWYAIEGDPEALGKEILEKLLKHIIPVYDILNSREAILAHRRDYPEFDFFDHLILLEESMVYGHMGDRARAEEVFNRYYDGSVEEYLYEMQHGHKVFIKKGESVVYWNARTDRIETFAPEESGEYVLYDARTDHIQYLEELADKNGISIHRPLKDIKE